MNSFYFANVAGLWALLGIPVVLLIHLLQQKTRRVSVSTLFLLQHLAPESVPGRSLQKLRKSMPLALQLLMVLLLAWLLAEPRWLRPESNQTIVIVLDSSASMLAFRDEAISAVKGKISDWEKGVAHTEWVVIESDSKRPILYRGRDDRKMGEALEEWKPGAGSHDWATALELAQNGRTGPGRIVVVTDREMDLPAGVGLLAVGRPLANVGFSGVVVEKDEKGKPSWRATLQNYSDSAQTRTWRAETGGVEAPGQSLTLAPRQVKVLGGSFPPGQNRLELVLGADEFSIDDRLPIVLPEPKPLVYFSNAGGETGRFFQRLAAGIPAVTASTDPALADLMVLQRRMGQPVRETQPALLFYGEEKSEGTYNPQPVVAEDHPLVRDLNWQGLLGGGPGLFEKTEEDRVLLWQANQPLVLLREKDRAGVLIFNFDFEHSNAARLPAFIVLIHRFLESLRDQKVAGWSDNFETYQPLRGLVLPLPEALEYTGPEGTEAVAPEKISILRAPAGPGFFSLKQGKTDVLGGAAHFGDPREADLSGAASAERTLAVSEETLRNNTEADPLQAVWILLTAAALLFSWWWQSALRTRKGATA